MDKLIDNYRERLILCFRVRQWKMLKLCTALNEVWNKKQTLFMW